jgi:hypothetical protein
MDESAFGRVLDSANYSNKPVRINAINALSSVGGMVSSNLAGPVALALAKTIRSSDPGVRNAAEVALARWVETQGERFQELFRRSLLATEGLTVMSMSNLDTRLILQPEFPSSP